MRAMILPVLLLAVTASTARAVPADSVAASVPADSAATTPAPAAPAPSADDVRVRSWQTGWIAPDKLEHASLSLTAGLMIGVATREPAAALGGSFALGLGKEVWDRRRTFFDVRDLAADLVGAGAAALLTAALRR